MRQFCQLFWQLDRSGGTSERVAALVAYFATAPAGDAAWALHCLLGKQRRRLITARRLRLIALEATALPAWLLEASYAQVGDSAETIALLVGRQEPDQGGQASALDQPLQHWMEQILPPLAELEEGEQAAAVRALWQPLAVDQVLVMVKLLTGTFRVGVGSGLVLRALAQLSGLEASELQHRLMGRFQPGAAQFEALLAPAVDGAVPASRPYPFLLACPLEPQRLEDTPAADWLVEWKWDGIRGQLIHRGGEGFLWSRGEELIGASFPELIALARQLPEGTVLDGEVLVWQEGAQQPDSFAQLQRRLGRQKPAAALLRECPAVFLAYDLLESEGGDRRGEPLQQRRDRLAALVARVGEPRDAPQSPEQAEVRAAGGSSLRLSFPLPLARWEELEPLRQAARQAGAEGLMVKQRASVYGSGRRRGSWWKHKLDPLRLDAVLLYARNGSGRRANLYTDYTFGLWQHTEGEAERRLVSFASAYSGLTDAEILELDRWIRRHTTERFGPVRAVAPELVFELAFEGVQRSGRHRSGVAVRFPRISRWRRDKPAAEADSLATALALIPG